jgi:hypothetical protein
LVNEKINGLIAAPFTPQVTHQVKNILSEVNEEMTRVEIQDQLELSDKKNFNKNFLLPA